MAHPTLAMRIVNSLCSVGFRGLSVSAVALCALLWNASAGPTPRFTDAENHYSFQPPEGWQRRMDLPKPIVAFLGPEEEDFSANFSVNLMGKPVENEDLDKLVAQVKIENGDIYARTKTALNGIPARAWRTHLHVPGHPVVENRQILCVYNKRVYELTFTMKPDTVKKYDPVFEKIVASFRWEKEPSKAAPAKQHKG
ncbi:MAG TPA: hypothetical protein VKU00_08515 [Chthonomonadaceae bacterium]|nr:hypothetical protein [Chthonomonadaceae bacterium]